MTYSFRQLFAADTEAFKQLIRIFGEAFDERDTYQKAVPSDEYLQALLNKEDYIVLAALDAEAVVGGLVAYELKKFEQERKEIFIYDLAVSESHRRKGIATALIEQLKVIAKNRGAYTICVQADMGDEAAINLYEKYAKGGSFLNFDIPV